MFVHATLLVHVLSTMALCINADGLITQELGYFRTSGAYNATVSVTENTDRYMILASGEPDHVWGMVNPNKPTDQSYNIPIPKNPTTEAIPGCLALGMIGIARTGVALFNPLDSAGENAVEGSGQERLDSCDGHADQRGVYHYHKLPFNCLYDGRIDEFMGVALDGYAIYGPKITENGVVKNLTSHDLDKCHGRIGSDGRYRYHMTFTFPYILGCFRGSVMYGRTTTQAICSSDTSVWNGLFKHYLCNCSVDRPTTGGNNTDPACHPSNANKPSYCCERQPPPPYCTQTDTTPRPVTTTARPATTTSRTTTTTVRPTTTTAGLTTQELGYFQTTGAYNATVSINEHADRYMVLASGEPDHVWGMVNPNKPTDQSYNIPIPKNPTTEAIPGCLALGMIGIARTGVALFNPLDSAGENAVEGSGQERLDSCDGHADQRGVYHYHKLPFNCLYDGRIDEFMGVALDGYAIYGPKITENGVVKDLTSHDLDKCHGRIGSDGRYRYHMTFTFPYILGCFRGSVMYDRTTTQAICSSDTSVWNNIYDHFLCNCSRSMPPTGGNNTDPACHPSNANKPSYCCERQPPPPYCSTTTRPTVSTPRPTGPTQTCYPNCETNGAQMSHQNSLQLILLACGYGFLQCLFQTIFT
ncbi:uncharacterized protein LOC110445732 [Mizuhopecten yessoensis]|nr:uncharacterized protein LOC110445732 [Mizuhopecten yessoensis]